MLEVASVTNGLLCSVPFSQIIFKSIFLLAENGIGVLVPENIKGVLRASWPWHQGSWGISSAGSLKKLLFQMALLYQKYCALRAFGLFSFFFGGFLTVVLHSRKRIPQGLRLTQNVICPSLCVNLRLPSNPWSLSLAWRILFYLCGAFSQAEEFLNNRALGSQCLVKHGQFSLAMFWGAALMKRCLLCTF